MAAWDWIIMLVPLALCTALAVYSHRLTRSVAHFMAGGRHAGRFMISSATAEINSSSLFLASQLQIIVVAGYTFSWWHQIVLPSALLLAVSGFVIYRYRQTRALTLAQFFEMRYSRRFRLCAGALGFFSGVLNFGIGPIISARFFIYFMQLPVTVTLGGVRVPLELLVMAGLLLVAVVMATAGGQITVLLTSSVEGVMTLFLFTFVVVMILWKFFDWTQMRTALLDTPPGQSLVNPYDTYALPNFDGWFVMMYVFLYSTSILAFQMGHAFNSSALTPHESRMGSVLAQWRRFAEHYLMGFLGVCVIAFLYSRSGAQAVDRALAHSDNPDVVRQMRAPMALSLLLPVGAKGALLAAELLGTVATLVVHMHSWGSIFIQDVVLPLRKTPLSVTQHLRLLRWTIIGVAVWGFLFGWLFPMTEYLTLWFAISTGVFTSGAGSVIMGGLYWRRGTTAAAWTSLILGAVLNLGGIFFRLFYLRHTGHEFILNPQHIAVLATVAAMLAYVGVSLLTCRRPHNMDQLLHRGAYAVANDALGDDPPGAPRLAWWWRVLGVGARFSRADRWVTALVTGWGLFWTLVFLVLTFCYFFVFRWSNAAWARYWLVVAMVVPVLTGLVTLVWFTVGSVRDLRVFFRRLRTEPIDNSDDGTVSH